MAGHSPAGQPAKPQRVLTPDEQQRRAAALAAGAASKRAFREAQEAPNAGSGRTMSAVAGVVVAMGVIGWLFVVKPRMATAEAEKARAAAVADSTRVADSTAAAAKAAADSAANAAADSAAKAKPAQKGRKK